MLFLLLFFLCFLLQLFLPWWIIAPACLIGGYLLATSARHAFKNGFGAVAVLWLAAALFFSLPNENVLANRVGQLFKLPPSDFNWLILALITAIIGGLVAGLAAATGFYLRAASKKQVRTER